MTTRPPPVRVTALYHFTRFEDPAALRGPLLELCDAEGVKGTLLLAREGVNGTVAGPDAGIERLLAHLRALPGCANLQHKDAPADATPFYRMKVRLKREIVTMGEPDIDPLKVVGTYVKPQDWNALIAAPDTIVIDTRNDYEVSIGAFDKAIDPKTKTFREFPDWFRQNRDALLAGDKPPKVAMYCTGGIRCEKATAFVKALGVDEVYHLEGGILKYLETVPEPQSLWRGECFVFDQRVSVGHGLVPGEHVLCHGCRMPVSQEDRQKPEYIEGVSCPACHDARDATQRARYAERQRQIALAQKKGQPHLGARHDLPD